uniref:Uncharacterized protein n=1 Tax=Glossina palpalis gambiensis TaxID=67801 RepID=A0A1B0BCL5_9MUSC
MKTKDIVRSFSIGNGKKKLMFHKNLSDLFHGIRNNKDKETKYIPQCIDEIKQGLRQQNVNVNMEECDHLCNRLAIMADGRIKCLGCVPELKQLHSAGFIISLQLVSTDVSDEAVHNSKNHAGILTYFVKVNNSIIWSQVFLKSEQFFRASSHLIKNYSVNESTLEDIFLTCGTRSHRKTFANDDYNHRTNGTMTTLQIEDV